MHSVSPNKNKITHVPKVTKAFLFLSLGNWSRIDVVTVSTKANYNKNIICNEKINKHGTIIIVNNYFDKQIF